MERVGASSSSGGMDRLSSLPDCLIHIIMSFLTAHEAVRTCILSKRWKNLWTTLPCLDFDMYKQMMSYHIIFDLSDGSVRQSGNSKRHIFLRFRDFVSMTLLNREASDIHKFRVSFSGMIPPIIEHCMLIRSWLIYALQRNPQVFHFDYAHRIGLLNNSLPPSVFTCVSLVDISLSCIFCSIGNIEVINLPCLKRLYLKSVDLYRNFVEKLFCGCPVLQMLHLNECNTEYSTINSQSLRYLTVENCVPFGKDN